MSNKIRKGDIFQYTDTVSSRYDSKKCYVDEVYEATNEIMVIFSWQNDLLRGGWGRKCRSEKELLTSFQSGHIVFVGNEHDLHTRLLRPHTFNPKLKNIPILASTIKGPYKTPKLYQWD